MRGQRRGEVKRIKLKVQDASAVGRMFPDDGRDFFQVVPVVGALMVRCAIDDGGELESGKATCDFSCLIISG